jgi:flagellar protein FlaF
LYGAGCVVVVIILCREAIIRTAASLYQKAAAVHISGHDTERAAFSLINRELAACTPGPTRVRALGRNHTLWSTLLQDLSLAENRLPDGIKTQLINLGLWAMRYSTLALLKDLSIEPLIEVNRNVMEGLIAQGAHVPGEMPQDALAQGNESRALA